MSLGVLMLGLTSCRDAKKEDAEEEAMAEIMDSMEQEASSLTEQVEADAKELAAHEARIAAVEAKLNTLRNTLGMAKDKIMSQKRVLDQMDSDGN